jgi:hypothetical protein
MDDISRAESLCDKRLVFLLSRTEQQIKIPMQQIPSYTKSVFQSWSKICQVFYTYFLSRTQAVDDQLRAANFLETGVLNVPRSLRAPPKSMNADNSSSQNLMHPCKNQKSA